MSATIHAVLLIPPDGDPQGLLATGPCEARPPIASLSRHGERWLPGADWPEHWPPDRALVLAWEGKPVPEGIDRVERRGAWDDTAERCRQWLLDGPRYPTYIVPPDLGSIVFLDADGAEVSP